MTNNVSRKQEARFRQLVGLLNTFIMEIRETEPAAEFYLDGGGYLNLMVGEHHSGNGVARPDNIHCRAPLLHSDAGDW